jgi:hypothetical protein
MHHSFGYFGLQELICMHTTTSSKMYQCATSLPENPSNVLKITHNVLPKSHPCMKQVMEKQTQLNFDTGRIESEFHHHNFLHNRQ